MPNPKRRHSKTRTAKRRTADALKPVPVGHLSAVPGGQGAAPGVRRTAATTRAARFAPSTRHRSAIRASLPSSSPTLPRSAGVSRLARLYDPVRMPHASGAVTGCPRTLDQPAASGPAA